MVSHQYIDRVSGRVFTEPLYADQLLRLVYAAPWEDRSWILRTVTSARASQLLGFLNYDLPFGSMLWGIDRFVRQLGVDLGECIESAERLDSPRKLFQRQIRYWETRPMDHEPDRVVAPADARMLVGSFAPQSSLFLKGKFFDFEELFGSDHPAWLTAFQGGDYAICRLTPDKYHYNHMPVSGVVRDIYELHGRYHSCNPGSVVAIGTPYSKNVRTVTVVDTDVPEGTGVGLVAFIEIVALMIGRIDQCYSARRYEQPLPVTAGMFLRRGQPKSLYRPGSSTTVAVFQSGRVGFCEDLMQNMARADVESRFSNGFGRSLVETDVKVRSTIGFRRDCVMAQEDR
ncbi:MAG: phosphatidylserine decarboxylase [Nitrospirae bacterium]|nr:phosphatidylserine decarboxylase [Nitrospirota bacterium]